MPVPMKRSQPGLEARKLTTYDARPGLPSGVQRGVGVHDELVEIVALNAHHRQVGEYATSAPDGKILLSGCHQDRLGEIGSAEFDVAGPSLFPEP